MKKEAKEDVQVCTAVGMLLSGVGLSIAGFIVPPTGQIHDSVLWFFAQCLMYAGSILLFNFAPRYYYPNKKVS